MRNPFENISLRDLQVTFDADLMEEAMQLHLDVQVEDMELDDEGTLRGYVRDGRRRRRVSIAPQNDKLLMSCDCGGMRGRPCAHALALLVEWVVDYGEVVSRERARPPEVAQPQSRVIPASFYPPADEYAVRSDWDERLQNLTVKEMRSLAAARKFKLKGTLREQVREGLLQMLVEPGLAAAVLERLAPDTRRLLSLLSALAGTAPRYSTAMVTPYLEAALDNGLAARPVSACLRELSDVGLYQAPEATHFYPVPLQVAATPWPAPGLFKALEGEPERVELAQPFQFTRLALHLLLMAQGGQLRCAAQDRNAARSTWPGPGVDRSAEEVEIAPEGDYLERGTRTDLASALDRPEAAIDLAARLLDGGGMWAHRAPQTLSERVTGWLRLSPQEQSRRLFALAAGFPTQLELDLARQAGFTPWRSPRRSPGYQEFLAEIGWERTCRSGSGSRSIRFCVRCRACSRAG